MKADRFILSLQIVMMIVAGLSCGRQNRSSAVPEDPGIHKIDSLEKAGYEIIDLHAHLKGGLTMEQLLDHSRITGIGYGVAVNCGFGFPIQNDSSLSAYYHSVRDFSVYHAMQAEGREWTEMFSPDSIELFDYVFTDAMTYFDAEGRRTRLWIKEEVFIEEADSFMDYYVAQIVEILNYEPIDIYVNPTFLPEQIAGRYDELWTPDRMQKVILALQENEIALEINSRYKIPSAGFIKKAKEAGVRFTMGTNNGDNELGYLEYGLQMIEDCDLTPNDFWKPDGKLLQ
ncbi:MAG: hypothetical protein JSV24_00850 [Bacteroidales bacterium]|nr:MAG: hypothetical protein JSV24_00850 [Bacteroidales bacterium]